MMKHKLKRATNTCKLTMRLLGGSYPMMRLWQNRGAKGRFAALVLILSGLVIPLTLFIVLSGVVAIWAMIVAVFVGITLTIAASAIVLFVLIWSNEEHERLNNRYQDVGPYNIFIDAPTSQVAFTFNQEQFFAVPKIVNTLYCGLDVDPDTYFRINAGPLDIPKITLRSFEKTGSQWSFHLGACAFRDIFFTHYFADYPLGEKRDEDNEPPTLRTLLSPAVDRHYRTQLAPDRISGKNDKPASRHTFHALPNPLGITGIVIIRETFAGEESLPWYLLQMRRPTDAADRGRLQWSFAGTLDVFPELWSTPLSLSSLIYQELHHEVTQPLDRLFAHCSRTDERVLGLIFNARLLYQPELVTLVSYNVTPQGCRALIDLETSTQKWLAENAKPPRILVTKGLSGIVDLLNHPRIKSRAVFAAAKTLLEKHADQTNPFIPF